MKHTAAPGRRNTGNPRSAFAFGDAGSELLTITLGRPGTRIHTGRASQPEAESELLLEAPAQDPQVVYAEGAYHYCESTSKGIFIRSAESLRKLADAPKLRIWAPASRGACSKNIWAPELHFLDGRWHVYFAADDGRNENHRMFVLVSEGTSVRGPYRLAGSLDTNGWAIDGTAFRGEDGELYFIWSGWPGATDGQQNLYISRMTSPTELSGPAVLLAAPTQAWERNGMPICEGPQVLCRNGRVFVIYSASASWTAEYCLGMIVHEGGDIMESSNWRKAGQVFGRNDYACGVGHCGFVTSPEGEHWILYHAKTRQRPGWNDREVRAQQFRWTHGGYPRFGEPGRKRRRDLDLVRI